MKRVSVFLVTLGAAALALLIPGAAAAAPILSFSPDLANVVDGTSFGLDVFASDVTDLYTFQFDVLFDPGVLQANAIDEGPFLASGGTTFFIPGVIDNLAGTISFTVNTLIGPIPGVSGSSTLATIQFAAIAPSMGSMVALQNVLLLDSGFGFIDAAVSDGTVVVSADAGPTPVPEPTSMLLVAGGLLALAVVRAAKSIGRVRRYA